MPSRTYRQRARAEHAAHTRTAIIEAVFEPLQQTPAEPIAVDRIAHMAGVARSSFYAWALTSFETFDSLYTGCSLPTRKTVALLVEMAERALYAQPYERASLLRTTA